MKTKDRFPSMNLEFTVHNNSDSQLNRCYMKLQ